MSAWLVSGSGRVDVTNGSSIVTVPLILSDTLLQIPVLRPRIVELGGSRAQRDVFHDTLFEACFRAGDAERAGRFLAERLARRPDHFWRSRAA
jgi:hypothetical protein